MPQNISGAPVTTHANGRKSAPAQVDSYADRLMDDLFEDVEDLLSGSVPPPEPIRAQPQKSPEFVMPPALSPIVARPQATLPNLPQWNASPEVDKLTASKPLKLQGNRFQKFLAIAFGLTALAAASAWLVQRGTAQRLFAMATQEPAAIATSTKVKALPIDTTTQFAKYMQRSLDNIDRRASTKPTSVVAFRNGLPPIPVGDSKTNSKTPVVINVPSIPSAMPVTNTVSRTPQELNQVLARLTSALERLSINPASVRAASTPSAPLPIAIQPSIAPEPQRLLRGIAIATDPTQSAILFEMNGVTQRYYVGESIGSSGWSVVDISNNYVTVRRNGEVRSISIGQKL